jgi:hypothetical protein
MRRYGNEIEVEVDVELRMKDLLKILTDLDDESKAAVKEFLETGSFNGDKNEVVYNEEHDATGEYDLSTEDIIEYINSYVMDKGEIFQECFADDFELPSDDHRIVVDAPNMIAKIEFEEFYKKFSEKWNISKY